MSESSYRQLEAICNSTLTALMVVDQNQFCTYMNPAAQALTGYSVSELAEGSLFQLLDYTGTVISNNGQARVSAGDSFRHKRGHRVHAFFTARRLDDQDASAGTLVEATQILDTGPTNSVSESKGGFTYDSHTSPPCFGLLPEAALDSIHSHIYVWDAHRRFVYANRSMETLWKLAPADYLGKTTEELGCPAELSEQFNQQIDHVFRTGAAVRSEVNYTCPAGEAKFYDYIFNPIINSRGDVEFVVGESRDTTDRKKLEEALTEAKHSLEEKVHERTQHLRLSEERYRRLFECIDQGLCIVEVLLDERGRAYDALFLEVNPGFRQHTGLADVEGKTAREVAPDLSPDLFGIYEQVVRTGEPVNFTNTYPVFGGRWFDIHAFAVNTPGANQIAMLFADITAQRQSEEAVQHAYSLMEGITAGSDDFIAALDPEFRFLYYNDAYQNEFMRLWQREVKPGLSIAEAMAPWPEEKHKALAVWSRALAGESFSITMAFGPDDCKTFYELRFNPICDASGRTIGAANILRDVTHRIELERSYQEIEERYRLISRATNDVIWDWDLESDRIEWNEAVLMHFGCTAEQMGPSVDWWYSRIHPNDYERVANGIKSAIATGKRSWSDEYRFRRSDDSYATYLDRGYIARDSEGKPYRMIGAMLDLTERRRAVETLRRNAATDAFRVSLADAIRPHSDPLRIQAESTRILGEHLQATGAHYAEISENGDYGLLFGEYAEGVQTVAGQQWLNDFGRTIMDEVRDGRTVVVADVQRDERLAPDEQEFTLDRDISAYVVVPLIRARRIAAAFVVHQSQPRAWETSEVALIEETADRTWIAVQRARIEDALRASEQRFRLLTDGIPHMVWLATADGHFEFFNRQFTAYTGAAYEPLETLDFVERFVHPDDINTTLDAWLTAVANRSSFTVEHRIRSEADEYRWFAARAEPQIDPATGEILRWFGTMTDIHNQKVAEESLRETDRQKDEFLAMLAHELRNPLAAVRNVERLLEPTVANDTNGQRYMKILRRQTSTLSELVEELLDVSRITRGLVELKNERVALAEIVDRALESVQALLDEKSHQVTITLPREPVVVFGDPVRLEQIMVNLLTNAAKYTDPGGKISVTLNADDTQAQLRIHDSGIGMTPEVISRVFTLFGQAERGLDRAQGGLGIGLTVVQNLVELHGGSIRATSEGLGKGAEFTVTLPLAPAQQNAASAPLPPDTKSVRAKRVLVVDDSEDVAETLALLLENSGHQVAVAHDGPSALAKADNFAPELVLLDIGLPGMDGYQLAEKLQANHRTRHAVLAALTGYGQASDRQRAEAAGFDAHFVKPVDFNVLEAFVNELAVQNNA